MSSLSPVHIKNRSGNRYLNDLYEKKCNMILQTGFSLGSLMDVCCAQSNAYLDKIMDVPNAEVAMLIAL